MSTSERVSNSREANHNKKHKIDKRLKDLSII